MTYYDRNKFDQRYELSQKSYPINNSRPSHNQKANTLIPATIPTFSNQYSRLMNISQSQQFQQQLMRQLKQEMRVYDVQKAIQGKISAYQRDGQCRVVKSFNPDKQKGKTKETDKFKAYQVKMKIPKLSQIWRPGYKTPQVNLNQIVSPQNTRKTIDDTVFVYRQIFKQPNYSSKIDQLALMRKKASNKSPGKKISIRHGSVKVAKRQPKKIELHKSIFYNSNMKLEQNLLSVNQKSHQYLTKNHNFVDSTSRNFIEAKLGNINSTGYESKFLNQNIQKYNTKNQQYKFRTQQKRNSQKKCRIDSPTNQDIKKSHLNQIEKGIIFKKHDLKKIVTKPKDVLIQAKKVERKKTLQPFNKIDQVVRTDYMQKQQKIIIQSQRKQQTNKFQSLSKERTLSRQIKRPIKETSAKRQPQKVKIKGNILVMNSQDKYIARYLIKLGWIVNHDYRSDYYTLKWVFKPNMQDYNKLKDNQFINHLKNSYELTSKNYLNSNLQKWLSNCPQIKKFYPICYDIAKTGQRDLFISAYQKDIMMNLLKQLFNYIRSRRPQVTKTYLKFYTNKIQHNAYKQYAKGASPFRNKKFKAIALEDFRLYDNEFLCHSNLVLIALKYWRNSRKKQQLQLDQQKHFLEFDKQEFDINFNSLKIYSKTASSGYLQMPESGFIKQHYSTPSNLAIERIVKQYVYFQKQLSHQWTAFGQQNIWIVKPSSASRGNGIYLSSDSHQILFNNKGIQSRIVQKYIEKPLIFQNSKLSWLNGKKFDIRQWVLVSSIQPLKIYMFSHCYLRVCSQTYSTENIFNLSAHLTNFSFNKKAFINNKGQSVVDHDTFVDLLYQECDVFQTDLKPKIEKIIIQSIKSAQFNLSDCNNRCFSLLGYDILIDENINPWLLEVNMSPACEERTQWLKQYLKVMGKGLLQLILPEDLLKSQQNNILDQVINGQMDRFKTDLSCDLQKQVQNQNIRQIPTDLQNLENFQIQKKLTVFKKQQKIAYKNQENGLYLIDRQDALQAQYDEIYYVEGRPQCMETPQNQINQIQNQKDNIIDKTLNNQISPCKTITDLNKKQIISLYNFKWQLICHEQYKIGKKQPQIMQITGTKIGIQNILSMDNKINFFQKQSRQCHFKIKLLQKAIKSFLKCKNDKNKFQLNRLKSEQSVGILSQRFSRAIHNRHSNRSALLNYQERSLWHFNYQHFYNNNTNQKVLLNKPKIHFQVGKSNISRDVSFKNKLRSIANQSCFVQAQTLKRQGRYSYVAKSNKSQKFIQSMLEPSFQKQFL